MGWDTTRPLIKLLLVCAINAAAAARDRKQVEKRFSARTASQLSAIS